MSAWPGRSASWTSSRPAVGEWDSLNAEQQRLAHGQALLDGARAALAALSDDEPNADGLTSRAIAALEEVQRYDAHLADVAEVLRAAQAQLEDAAHTLQSYLGRSEPDPDRLAELDARLGAWVALARRYRRSPAELPALLTGWQAELRSLDAAADLDAPGARRPRRRDGLARTRPNASRALRQKAAPALGRRGHPGHAATGHGRRPLRGGAAEAGRAAVLGPGSGGVPRCGPRRQHAAAAGQGGLGRRTVAARLGHRRHHGPA